MVLFTWAMEWHIMQPSPAWASGLCTNCLMGVSILPAYSTAGSWHPPHHFEGRVPTVSCMYSTLLRYHWLLNEEKWCTELYHWLKMSWWQRLQESDSMKNLLGIFFPPNTWAELGKNGPLGPSPSSSMVAGEVGGLSMRARFSHREWR